MARLPASGQSGMIRTVFEDTEDAVRGYYLYPVIPALALVLMPFLPFVNTSQLWFGLPRMIVWGALSCLALTISLIPTERGIAAREEDE